MTHDLVLTINEVETILKGTDFHWLLRQDGTFGYFANICNSSHSEIFPTYHSNAVEALRRSLRDYLEELIAETKKS